VDQAFASQLRQATLQAQHITLTGDALALSQRVAQLQQLIAQDQAQFRALLAIEFTGQSGKAWHALPRGQRRP